MDNRNAESIKVDLNRLFAAMSRLGLELPSLLEPGLTRQEIKAVFNSIGLTPPEDVIEFYEFSNGADADGKKTVDQIGFFERCYLLPLHRAVDVYQMFMELLEGTESFSEELSASCFPFLDGGDGRSYLIDFEAERLGKPSVLFHEAVQGTEIEFSSLRSMIQTLAESFEQGAFIVKDGRVDYDTPESEAIFQKYNPDVPDTNNLQYVNTFSFSISSPDKFV